MELITETYFGWDSLSHAADCPTPVWDEAQMRHTEGIRPQSTGPDHHACEHPNCTHADTFRRLQLRLACRDCGTVHTIGAEGPVGNRLTIGETGWGQAPTQHGGVWLWPGRPAAPGREPREYLVTLQGAAITRATLYGIITGYRDSSGNPVWQAGCGPADDGAHQISAIRWRHASPAYDSVEACAEFIHITARFPQRTVVVNV
ncbi:hypothetical protein [Streptomyces sp. enrichment culture]|uniref:hypothetical protein n=1 Tax=Streptomyces sp. enrichment culture TaxID=1795815 RepID=UPI003F5698FE